MMEFLRSLWFGKSKAEREREAFIDRTAALEEALTRCLAVGVSVRLVDSKDPADAALFAAAQAMAAYTNLDGVSADDAHPAYLKALQLMARGGKDVELRRMAERALEAEAEQTTKGA